MKIIRTGIIPILLASFLFGCYPSGPDFVEDYDAILTTYDEEFQFDARKTYARPDKIVIDVEISRGGDTTFIYMDKKFADKIFAAIDRNMESLGWEKTQINFLPDVLLTPAAMKSTNYYYSYWYDWWYGPGYGGWGWYYPPYYTVSSTTTGTLFITMADPNVKDDSPINQSQTAWLVVANGLLVGNFVESRVINSIDQAFDQSPYLKIN